MDAATGHYVVTAAGRETVRPHGMATRERRAEMTRPPAHPEREVTDRYGNTPFNLLAPSRLIYPVKV